MNKALLAELHQLHAEVCGALADPKRIAILYLLDEGPKGVNELAEALALPQATVSRHLKVLRERGMVASERAGVNVRYSLTNRKIIRALDLLREVLAETLARRGKLAAAMA